MGIIEIRAGTRKRRPRLQDCSGTIRIDVAVSDTPRIIVPPAVTVEHSQEHTANHGIETTVYDSPC